MTQLDFYSGSVESGGLQRGFFVVGSFVGQLLYLARYSILILLSQVVDVSLILGVGGEGFHPVPNPCQYK